MGEVSPLRRHLQRVLREVHPNAASSRTMRGLCGPMLLPLREGADWSGHPEEEEPVRETLLVLAVFAACLVESVEALTIVLAVGVTRSWNAALRGVAAGLVVLAAVTAVLGPALTVLPLDRLRLIVGGLLLVFGLGWLRKAILRASGFKALHDETAIFERQRAEAEAAGREGQGLLVDPYAFTIAFKGVVLEGLEVVFIVLTFGANQHDIPLASVGAAIAVVVVVVAGFAVRAPLARVPENTLKFVVGVLLTSFGTFWGAEGAGASWPGSDAALLGVIAFVAATAVSLVAVLRGVHGRRAAAALVDQPMPAAAR